MVMMVMMVAVIANYDRNEEEFDHVMRRKQTIPYNHAFSLA